MAVGVDDGGAPVHRVVLVAKRLAGGARRLRDVASLVVLEGGGRFEDVARLEQAIRIPVRAIRDGLPRRVLGRGLDPEAPLHLFDHPVRVVDPLDLVQGRIGHDRRAVEIVVLEDGLELDRREVGAAGPAMEGLGRDAPQIVDLEGAPAGLAVPAGDRDLLRQHLGGVQARVVVDQVGGPDLGGIQGVEELDTALQVAVREVEAPLDHDVVEHAAGGGQLLDLDGLDLALGGSGAGIRHGVERGDGLRVVLVLDARELVEGIGVVVVLHGLAERVELERDVAAVVRGAAQGSRRDTVRELRREPAGVGLVPAATVARVLEGLHGPVRPGQLRELAVLVVEVRGDEPARVGDAGALPVEIVVDGLALAQHVRVAEGAAVLVVVEAGALIRGAVAVPVLWLRDLHEQLRLGVRRIGCEGLGIVVARHLALWILEGAEVALGVVGVSPYSRRSAPIGDRLQVTIGVVGEDQSRPGGVAEVVCDAHQLAAGGVVELELVPERLGDEAEVRGGVLVRQVCALELVLGAVPESERELVGARLGQVQRVEVAARVRDLPVRDRFGGDREVIDEDAAVPGIDDELELGGVGGGHRHRAREHPTGRGCGHQVVGDQRGVRRVLVGDSEIVVRVLGGLAHVEEEVQVRGIGGQWQRRVGVDPARAPGGDVEQPGSRLTRGGPRRAHQEDVPVARLARREAAGQVAGEVLLVHDLGAGSAAGRRDPEDVLAAPLVHVDDRRDDVVRVLRGCRARLRAVVARDQPDVVGMAPAVAHRDAVRVCAGGNRVVGTGEDVVEPVATADREVRLVVVHVAGHRGDRVAGGQGERRVVGGSRQSVVVEHLVVEGGVARVEGIDGIEAGDPAAVGRVDRVGAALLDALVVEDPAQPDLEVEQVSPGHLVGDDVLDRVSAANAERDLVANGGDGRKAHMARVLDVEIAVEVIG